MKKTAFISLLLLCTVLTAGCSVYHTKPYPHKPPHHPQAFHHHKAAFPHFYRHFR